MRGETIGARAVRKSVAALALALALFAAGAASQAAHAVGPAAGPLEVFGHQYGAGLGASSPSTAWPARLSAALGPKALVNHSVAYSAVSIPFYTPPGATRGAQSWWWAYRNINPSGNPAAAPRAGQPAVFTGLNDLAVPDVGVTLDALRAFVARISENAVVEDTSPSVKYGLPWVVVPQVNRNSGSTAHGTVSPTARPVQITTPKRFPGGTVVLHGLADGGHWAGAVFVEGVQVASFDAKPDPSGRPHPIAIPLRGLPPGVNKIELRTIALAGGGAQFDFWGTITAASPYVLLFKQPQLLPAGDARFPSTPARIDQLNAGIDRIAREFDNVLAVDLSLMNANPALFYADAIDPNDLGHAYIAAQGAAALRAAPRRRSPAARKLSRLSLSPSPFTAARRGPTLRAKAKRGVGTTVRFRLNAPSTVRFTVLRRLAGGRYARTRGAFSFAGSAGRHKLFFTGRLARRALKPGRYRLLATVRDAPGRPAHKAFRIAP
jgi:hypothetical protein